MSDKRVCFNHGNSGMIRCLCKIDEPCFCYRLHDGRTATAHSTVLCRLTRDWGFSIHAEKKSACRGTGSSRDLTGIFFLFLCCIRLALLFASRKIRTAGCITDTSAMAVMAVITKSAYALDYYLSNTSHSVCFGVCHVSIGFDRLGLILLILALEKNPRCL